MKERLSIVKNAAISSLGTYAEYALGLVTSIWIARSLGPTEFGHYSFVIWLCGWMLIASNNALTTSSIKFLAEARGREDNETAKSLTAYLLRLQLASTAAVISIFLLTMLTWKPMDWSAGSPWIVPMIVVAVVTRASFAMRVAIAKGFERFEPEAVATITAGFASLGLVIFTSSRTHAFSAFVLIYMVASILLDMLVRMLLRKTLGTGKPSVLPPALLERVKNHLLSTGIMVVLLSMSARTIETLLLKATSTSEALGYFAISATLAKGAVDVLASGLSATLLPAMARSYGRAANKPSNMLPDSIRYFGFLGFGLAGGGYLVAPAVVHLLYGVKFDGAIFATQISLVVAGASLLAAPINAYQTSSDLQGDRIKVAAFSLFLNLIAGLLLVPTLGLTGALITHAIARAAYLLVAITYLQLRAPIPFPTRSVLVMLACGCGSYVVASLSGRLIDEPAAALLEASIFTALYIATTISARCWREGDFHLAERLLEKVRAPALVRNGVLGLSRYCASDSRRS